MAVAAVALFLCDRGSFFCALEVTGAVVEVNERVWPKALTAFVAWRLRSMVVVTGSQQSSTGFEVWVGSMGVDVLQDKKYCRGVKENGCVKVKKGRRGKKG